MTLTPPRLSGFDLRLACTPGITDIDRLYRMRWHESALAAEERAFRRSVDAGILRLFRSGPVGEHGVADMKWYYRNRLIGSVPGKNITADIYALSPERCPFCQAGTPSTLEHMFPKALFPWLAVEPGNLAPACKDCNLDRNEGNGHSSPNVYADTWISDHIWLTATSAHFGDPTHLLFDIDAGCGVTPAQAELLRTHLNERKLRNRYRIRAKQSFSDLLSDIRESRRVRPIAGRRLEDAVEETLTSRLSARTADHGKNYWEAAALRVWVADFRSIDWEGLTTAVP